MPQVFVIRRCADASRAGELLAFTHGIFGALVIDPPSGVLKETESDFVTRLKDGTCFIVEADGMPDRLHLLRQERRRALHRPARRCPRWRRRGVATALIEAAKAEARRIGAKRMTLGCRIALTSNVALFRRHGFVIVGYESSRVYRADVLRHGVAAGLGEAAFTECRGACVRRSTARRRDLRSAPRRSRGARSRSSRA